MATTKRRFLTIPLWQAVKQTYSKLIANQWRALMRYKIIRHALIATGVFIVLYALLISSTAVAIYHYKKDTKFTQAVERLFPYPAAIVNGTVIPLSRYRTEVSARTYYTATQKLTATPQETDSFVINQLEDRELYRQALMNNNITLSDTDLQNKLQDIYTQVGGQDKLITFLHQQYGPDVTLDLFKTWLREAAVESAVQNQLLTRVTLKHILIAVPANATPDQVEAARQNALAIKATITSPDLFASVAREKSEDIASRDNGGEFGTTNRGDDTPILSADFENAIFTLPINVVSDPIRSPYGWHLVLVESRAGTIDMSKKAFTASLFADGHVHTFIGN